MYTFLVGSHLQGPKSGKTWWSSWYPILVLLIDLGPFCNAKALTLLSIDNSLSRNCHRVRGSTCKRTIEEESVVANRDKVDLCRNTLVL